MNAVIRSILCEPSCVKFSVSDSGNHHDFDRVVFKKKDRAALRPGLFFENNSVKVMVIAAITPAEFDA